MSIVNVNIASPETLERTKALLAGIPGGVDKAVKAAMKKTTSAVRRDSADAIRERYDISKANIRTAENIKEQYRYENGVEATVVFSGKKIPLYRYNGAYPAQPTKDIAEGRKRVMVKGRWTMQYQGVAAKGHQLKTTPPSQFLDAFVARMKSGHVGIFERTGGVTSEGSDAIRELMGTAVPQMVGSETVLKKLTEEAHSTFERNLDDAVWKILSGG
jgi:hypothetical protein